MANKYCNLDGSKKIKDEYQKINIGFDKVEEDVNNIDTRVNNIITTPAEGVSAQEIIDARKGEEVLGDKIDKIDNSINEVKDELDEHKAESASKHIKESGSNANGRYIKFDDGTLICMKTDIAVIGTGSTSAQTSWTYPSAFISTPTVLGAPSKRLISGSSNTTVSYSVHCASVGSSGVSVLRFICPTVFDEIVELQANMIAIGRWK